MRERPDMLQVEFFGLPGSGKTTIARHVHSRLSSQAPPLLFAPDLLRDGAAAGSRAAAKLRLVARELGREGRGLALQALAVPQPTQADRMRAVFTLATMLALHDRLDRTGQGAILDQGLLQALWSIELRAPAGRTAGLRKSALDRLARDTRFVVCVETPVEVCADRLRARASRHSRMQAGGGEGDARDWARAELLHRAIFREFGAALDGRDVPPRNIVVEGTADPQDTARRIAARLLASASAPASSRRMSHTGASA